MRQKAIYSLLFFIFLLPAAGRADLSEVFEGRRSSSLRHFPKWTQVLNRYPDEAVPESWNKFLSSQEGRSRGEQIRAVNAQMNKSPYVKDIVNWGMRDYWETPLEFIRRRGDCEDYAIAKFFSLRRLGMDNDDMRIIVLKDHNINAMHSVLVVRNNDHLLVLDNQTTRIAEAGRVHHYEPIYSVNEESWWRYQ